MQHPQQEQELREALGYLTVEDAEADLIQLQQKNERLEHEMNAVRETYTKLNEMLNVLRQINTRKSARIRSLEDENHTLKDVVRAVRKLIGQPVGTSEWLYERRNVFWALKRLAGL